MVFRVLVALALALMCGVAHADKAEELFTQANDLYVNGNYTEALKRYDEALALSPHPAIRFNKAMCLIALDRTLEAYDEMELALAQGPDPLGAKLYADGQTQMRSLKGRIGTLTVEIKTSGARVTLDGKTELQGGVKKRVLAGEPHTLIGELKSYKTKTVEVILQGNEARTVAVELERESRGHTVRRWARWKPWAVVSASAVLGLAGGLTLYSSDGMYKDYDSSVTDLCPNGCSPKDMNPEIQKNIAKLDDKLSAADRRQYIGAGILVASGATLAVGLVLVVLNQPRLAGATVSPAIGKEHAGASVSFAW